MKRIMQFIGFYLFLAFEKFLMILPKKVRRSFFLFLGWATYKLSKRYNKVIRDNLTFIYGDKVTEEFIQRVAKYQFKLLLLNFLHTVESRYYSVEEMAKKTTFINDEVIKRVQKEGRPIIFITSHYGAWELGGSMLSAIYQPILIIFKKMKNPYFQNYLLGSRKKWKMTYAERQGATRAILKTLKGGGATAILIDTNVNPREAIKVKFLGKEISQIRTTAYFARKLNAAIIPLLIHTDDDENYTITCYDEIIPPKTDNEENDILISTQMQTDWLSEEILKNPDPWFWLHRRFKSDYPEIYN
jgi:KDO2-lipid IV(A) lauroyltransferase